MANNNAVLLQVMVFISRKFNLVGHCKMRSILWKLLKYGAQNPEAAFKILNIHHRSLMFKALQKLFYDERL